jgi:hypothetical protein
MTTTHSQLVADRKHVLIMLVFGFGLTVRLDLVTTVVSGKRLACLYRPVINGIMVKGLT